MFRAILYIAIPYNRKWNTERAQCQLGKEQARRSLCHTDIVKWQLQSEWSVWANQWTALLFNERLTSDHTREISLCLQMWRDWNRIATNGICTLRTHTHTGELRYRQLRTFKWLRVHLCFNVRVCVCIYVYT